MKQCQATTVKETATHANGSTRGAFFYLIYGNHEAKFPTLLFIITMVMARDTFCSGRIERGSCLFDALRANGRTSI